ncbi:MAG: hypothetical protein IT537_03245 [Hyphomicrobiales bacterium]|nr:hypothetical protein [Hyphomicrobiales bacterium]
MLRRVLAAALAALISFAGHAADNAVILTPGSGVTMRSIDVGSGVQAMGHVIVGANGSAIYGTAGSANTNVLTVQGIASGTALPVSLSSVPSHAVTVASGGIASGAFASGSIASGAMVDLGAIADAASSAGGTGSVHAKLRLMTTQLDNINTNIQGSIPAGSAIIGQTGIDQTTAGTTNAVSLKYLNTTAVAANSGNKDGGTLRVVPATDSVAVPLWGHGTSGASVPTGAQYGGGRAQNAEATAVSNGQLVGFATDLLGKQIVLPYANPENMLNGVPTAAITDTTSTQVLAAAGSGVRNYVTWCRVQNAHATVGTWVQILRGSTVIDSGWAGPNGGGYGGRYPTPQKSGANEEINCQATTTGASFKCTCGGYTGV